MTGRLERGDCRDVLIEMAARGVFVDSVVTDPPYHLTSTVKRFGKAGAAPAKGDLYARQSRGFMGKEWDGGDIAFRPETWRLVYDVMKPGAHLLAFGGTRTTHRMVCAIEDAGFEIRDSLYWVYGTGFPHSHDVSKGIDKAAGKKGDIRARGAPVARMIPGADQYATGSWIKDSGRTFQPGEYQPATPEAAQWAGWGTALKPAVEPICLARKPLIGTVAANVLAHGTGALNIDASRIASEKMTGGWPANLVHDGSDEVLEAFVAFGKRVASAEPRGDKKTAARFYYSAKASEADRCGSNHPTVKPLALMRWLCGLVTPPGGTVLDPFAGSGSTLQAAMQLGFHAIGIEMDPDYQGDILRRIETEELCA